MNNLCYGKCHFGKNSLLVNDGWVNSIKNPPLLLPSPEYFTLDPITTPFIPPIWILNPSLPEKSPKYQYSLSENTVFIIMAQVIYHRFGIKTGKYILEMNKGINNA